MFKKLKQIGPGAMVAAAFIGPGTVTTATIAGASYGFTLLWAVLFSTIATVVLQEMSGRLGVIGGVGVGEAIRQKVTQPFPRIIAICLVIGAVLIGNAAYEAGNISGAVLGFGGSLNKDWLVNPLVLIGVLSFSLLYSGKYKLIEKSLIFLVTILGVVFVISAILLEPNILEILKGMFVPQLPDGALMLVIGLIGTTVVPYNLFLHASSVKRKWSGESELENTRLDTILSVVFGGIITMCILITAGVAFSGESKSIETAADLSVQLQPILGSWAEWFIAIGFFAAGFSSSITAPLAAAFATSEILGWTGDMRQTKFRAVWFSVLMAGIVVSSMGWKPTTVILFAQVANGLLLPIIACFLLWVMNDQKIMRKYVNSKLINVFGVLVILITLALGLKSILSAFKFI